MEAAVQQVEAEEEKLVESRGIEPLALVRTRIGRRDQPLPVQTGSGVRANCFPGK
jgi:hypothetical protein